MKVGFPYVASTILKARSRVDLFRSIKFHHNVAGVIHSTQRHKTYLASA